ncbi:hypothetical protein Vadar_001232 [Vaccinium darrowii]|uniref:Uncharacterized protein n=1 Tax=Vaccinium darrowii TaxID=229202 RepID=A0ACB7XMC9_9ERIC|nr:hypothetical protein Vadar_001232 [Vaccinium darrowii]
MSNPLIVVDKIVEYFVGKVCQSVGRHVGFLFHYKQNLKTLEDEKNNLQQQRSNVQEKVDQAEHCGEAVDNKVSEWLQEDPPELELPSSRDYEDFHSRQKVFEDIVEALKDSNVNMIGVYGTGGVGIPIAIGNKRCKVVLTSRKRNVLENMGVQEAFHIEFLSEQEAWNLFKMKVGNHVDSYDQRLRDTARAVCNECKGLPVAINALGATLKGSEDMHAWEDALYKLKNSMLKEIEGIDPGVYASLRLSYDRLETIDAKLCFLLCCLFAEDAKISIHDLVRYYMAERILHHYQMLDTLQQALDRVCTVVEDEKSFLVKHGVRYWPEKATYEHCSVISLMPQDMGEFPNELICPKLHTLRLDCTVNNKFPLHIPDSFFGGTENLMVLDLNGVPMLSLPASLAKLAKLHMLCLNNCKLEDIAILKDLKNHLEILSLRNSDIKELPPEVGELTRLRLLELTNCQQLVMIPRGVISQLVLLEELYMPMTFNQWERTSAEREISNVSLDELMSLTHLTTLHICIGDPTLLPNRFSFENLARFIIIVGARFPGWWSEGTLGLENIHVENVLEFLLGNPTRKQSIRGNGFYPSTSFNHLGTLRVKDCRLKYLFSPSCARLLVQLESLEIRSCSIMEGVIGTEGENDEDIVFRRLKILCLVDLANLISFYPKKLNTATSSGSSSAHAQMALFNDKAAFPALERLEIHSVPDITEIWNKQILPIPETATESFCCQLLEMHIYRCGKLMNVVGGCPKIEAIEMEKQKGKVVDDYVTRFPKLTTLRLYGLPNLESFCNSSVRCEGQVPLFDHQAAFPALERLEIRFVPEITEIWNKQILPIPEIATESFCCQLSEMTISDCDKLVNVVGGCPKIEAIEMEKQKGKVVDDYATCFPKLTTLKLDDLPNLESFCNSSVRCEAQVPLFDHQVAFPVLKRLDIRTFPNITDIWDKKIRPAHQPFCPLHELYVEDCGELVYVVPSNMLPQLCNLERLTLDSCPMAEVIVDLEKREEGTQEAANNTIVPFPELSFLRLKRLQNIKGFCAFRSEEHRVFNTQVAFAKLEKLDVDTFGEIALRQLTDASELSLKRLEFYECDEVSTVVSPHFLRRLRFVDLLYVKSCRGARDVFHFDGLEVGEGQVCVGQLTQVRKVYLEDLPQLTCLWNKDPHRLLGLQSLEYLTIKNCPLLANLFIASVAKALGGLKVLCLRSCSTMEAVIATDEGHADVIDDDEIEFPKLEWLILKDLSNLKSFCTSNHNFNFPSLKRLVLKRCPKVQAFTSGSVLPQILLSTRGNECLTIEDLNKHLEQQHLKGDQETILDGEMKGDEDRFSNIWNLENY